MAANGTSATRPPDPFEKRLLDEFQRDFPLTPRPFAEIARRLDTDEESVLAAYARLVETGYVSRIGGVIAPHRAGWSTLAAMAVPEDRIDEVAELISRHDGVNHNYERGHRLNLWFVVTAPDEAGVRAVLDDIAEKSGLDVLDLPLEEAFHIDLGFALTWS